MATWHVTRIYLPKGEKFERHIQQAKAAATVGYPVTIIREDGVKVVVSTFDPRIIAPDDLAATVNRSNWQVPCRHCNEPTDRRILRDLTRKIGHSAQIWVAECQDCSTNHPRATAELNERTDW